MGWPLVIGIGWLAGHIGWLVIAGCWLVIGLRSLLLVIGWLHYWHTLLNNVIVIGWPIRHWSLVITQYWLLLPRWLVNWPPHWPSLVGWLAGCRWSLVGHWLVGHWLLVIGHWS